MFTATISQSWFFLGQLKPLYQHLMFTSAETVQANKMGVCPLKSLCQIIETLIKVQVMEYIAQYLVVVPCVSDRQYVLVTSHLCWTWFSLTCSVCVVEEKKAAAPRSAQQQQQRNRQGGGKGPKPLLSMSTGRSGGFGRGTDQHEFLFDMICITICLC